LFLRTIFRKFGHEELSAERIGVGDKSARNRDCETRGTLSLGMLRRVLQVKGGIWRGGQNLLERMNVLVTLVVTEWLSKDGDIRDSVARH
jgi:hypothetical protein